MTRFPKLVGCAEPALFPLGAFDLVYAADVYQKEHDRKHHYPSR
jgi:hypothetical protein